MSNLSLKNKLASVLHLQDSLNSKISNTWRNNNHAWHEAIIVECGETLDILGYKWWKKIDFSRSKAFGELVDVFHFLISKSMVLQDIDKVVEVLHDTFNADAPDTYSGSDPSEIRDSVVGISVKSEKDTSFTSGSIYYDFYLAISMLGFTVDDLVDYYIGKNALNAFRAENGYKEGTYVKSWGEEFKEDNDYLQFLIEDKDEVNKSYDWYLINLRKKYQSVINM